MQNSKSAEDILNSFKILRDSDLNENEFYNRYLEYSSLLCKSYFSVLIEKQNEHNLEVKYLFNKPSEQFINKVKDLSKKAQKQGFAYERYEFTDTNYKTPYVIVFRNHNLNTFVGLLLDKTIQSQFNESLVRTQLICDVPNTYFKNLEKTRTLVSVDKQELMLEQNEYKNPLELFNIIIHKENLNLALLTLVNELAFRFHCSQVSIGWIETNKIAAKAISSIESFEKNSDTVALLEKLFEEVSLQEEILIYPNSDKSLALYENEIYYNHKKVTQLVSIPIYYKNKVCGVLVCEMIDSELTQKEIDLIDLSVNQISPWLTSLQHKEESLLKKISRQSISYFEDTLSVKYTGLKLIVASLIFILFISLAIKVDYKVDGIASIETDYVTYISAPFDAVIETVNIKEGDDVLKDDLLLTLDINELKLKANESKSNILRYSQEAEKARATYSLADMKIALSKKEAAQISLNRVNYYIKQSKIKAPYDGIVVEGDHTKLVGSPVSKGDVILKIAKLGSMYLKIKVSEKDIDNIKKDGKFIFLSRPNKAYNIKIDKIIPIAEVDKSEGNIFVVKAFIDEKEQSWWRPGMSGVTKIDAGERSIFWIATHKLVDFLRIYLWW